MTPMELQEFIDASRQAQSVQDIHELCTKLCHHLEYNHFVYAARFPTSFVKPYYVIISGYPDEWYARYTKQGYMLIDPAVKHCDTHNTPLIWEFMEFSDKQAQRAKKFMSEAAEFGLRSGITIPIHGAHGEVAVLSMVREEEAQKSRSLILSSMPTIQFLSFYIHEGVRNVMSTGSTAVGQIQLTNREKECLLWAAEGKSSWEISKILNISENTVIFHIKNTSKKLNVANRQQAIARAIAYGLITPQLL